MSSSTPKYKTVRILCDTGATATIVKHDLVKNLNVTRDPTTSWTTPAGTFKTDEKVRLDLKLPEFHQNKNISWSAHVTRMPMNYDIILGEDLLKELQFIINYKDETLTWDDVTIPMRGIEDQTPNFFAVSNNDTPELQAEKMHDILAAKYSPADLPEVVKECSHLNEEEKSKLLVLLQRYEDLFDGTLGHWQGPDYGIELKPGVEPYHARPYPVPKAYEQTLRNEVERMCEIGILKKVNRSEWAAPTFIIPKKDQTVRFISDFRELNKRIKRKPFPIPKIQDLMLKLEGFQYGTSLDLNMAYYHIELNPDSKRYCTVVLPWGKYEYQRLPMGLCNSPDIFQERMSTLMADLEFVRVYIDDLLCITNGTWEDHLEKLEEVLKRVQKAGLKVNAKKSFFGRPELEYLGYWVTRQGIQPLKKKVEAMSQIAPPTNRKQLRRFLGMVNYYRDMWVRRSEVLAPLTALTSEKKPFKWDDQCQKAFDTMKRILSKEVLLTYPDFNKPFDIHTDASDVQLGAVISQNEKPIAFYTRKLNPAQTRYTTTERELLAIVETLKEFRNILLGQQITIYTDHKNLCYKNFNTNRVMRWRLLLEEYGPTIKYIKGERNVVADALSRLDLHPQPSSNLLQELFGVEDDAADLPPGAYPLKFKTIDLAQQQDKKLMSLLKKDNSSLHLKNFHGGGKSIDLVCYKGKIVMPEALQKRTVKWYHDILCHPGRTRTEATIAQHFYWPNMRKDVEELCSKCKVCQLNKRNKKKYGHLPEKEAEAIPWDKLCVDLIGPYTIKRKGKSNLTLWCVTMIDPATSWFELRTIPTKRADVIANIVEQTWLSRYPWPTQIVFDRGTEFMAEFAEMVVADYGIKRKPITKRNPQANAIIERIHQTLGNIIRTLDKDNVDDEDPWSGILAAAMFALRATYHTTTQATPMQLVFGRDAILNTVFEANWKYIRDRKQKIIRKNNQKENSKRIPHEYAIGDKVLLDLGDIKTKFDAKYEGPYTVVQVNNNGTVRIRKGAVTDTVNIRIVTPYQE